MASVPPTSETVPLFRTDNSIASTKGVFMKSTRRQLPNVRLSVCLTGAFLFFCIGCSWTPRVTGIIHESYRGSVYLEEVPNMEFEATHPAQVEPSDMGRILQNILVSTQGSSTSNAPTQGNKIGRQVFTEQDVQFLAPILSSALRRASPEHQVAFRTIESAPPHGPSATAGSLYIKNSFLYLTLSHIGYTLGTPDILILFQPQQRLPTPSDRGKHVVRFEHDAVGNATRRMPTGAPLTPSLTTLAIDLRKVHTLPAIPSLWVTESHSPRPSDQSPGAMTKLSEGDTTTSSVYAMKMIELREANHLVAEKMAVQRALRKELQVIRENLRRERQLVKQLHAYLAQSNKIRTGRPRTVRQNLK